MSPPEIEALRAAIAERAGMPAPVLVAIIRTTALAFGIDPDRMLDRVRDKSIAEARNVAYYVARKATRMSYPELGRAFGKRDHTTIMSGCARVSSLIERDKWIAATVAVLLEQFGGEPEAEARAQ